MSGPQDSFRHQVEFYGEEFVRLCQKLNALCYNFYTSVIVRVFENEQELIEIVGVFREKVLQCAGGTRKKNAVVYTDRSFFAEPGRYCPRPLQQ